MKKLKGKAGAGMYALILIVGLLAVWVIGPSLGLFKVSGGGGGLPISDTNCPDTGSTSLKIQMYNADNTSGTGPFDGTIVCTGSDGSTYTITDTTSPTATTINCGFTYRCKGVSSNTNAFPGDDYSGIGANILALRNGPSGTAVSNGELTFSAVDPNVNIDVSGIKLGFVEARLYDKNYASYVYGGSGTASKTKGNWIRGNGIMSEFGNYTNNRTASTGVGAMLLGTGEGLDLELDLRTNDTQVRVGDFGYWLFVDASTTKWEVPTVRVNGKSILSTCAARTDAETKAYSGEEYCYYVTDVMKKSEYTIVDFSVDPTTGTNPATTDSINVTLAIVGGFQSTADNTNVMRGAVKDDSSFTQVYTLEEWKINVQ